MALHTQLPIYRAAYALLDVVTDLVKNMPRDFKRSIGEKISVECIEIMVLVFRANVAADKLPHLAELLERLDAINRALVEREARAAAPQAEAAGHALVPIALLNECRDVAHETPTAYYLDLAQRIEAAIAAAPSPDSEQVGETLEGCTSADAAMLRAANHSLAAENDHLRRRLRPFAQLASSPLSWAMVEYCIADDPEKQTLQAPQMQRAFNRAAEALNENTGQQSMPMMDIGESGLVAEMLEALEAVVSVADRATIEFDKARSAIERARTACNADTSPSRECGEPPFFWHRVIRILVEQGVRWKQDGWVFQSDDDLHKFALAVIGAKGE